MNPAILIRHWKHILLGLVMLWAGFLYLHLQTVTAQLELRDAKIAEMQRIADEYQSESTQIAKEIGDAIPRVVEQAEKVAYQNYVKRFGTGNAACGIRVVRMPAEHSPSEADSAEGTDGLSEQEFVAACATDAGVIEQWRKWAIANQLPVE